MMKRSFGLLMLCIGLLLIGLFLSDMLLQGMLPRELIPFRGVTVPLGSIVSLGMVFFGWKWLRGNRFEYGEEKEGTATESRGAFVDTTMADQFSKLLLIDNDTVFQNAFSELCKKNNKKLSVAHTAEQGMDLASRGKFDAIVMSVELPDKNGLSVCEHFKNSADLRTIPVVMVSNQITGETLNFHKQLSVRADAYFLKADAHRAVTRETGRNS